MDQNFPKTATLQFQKNGWKEKERILKADKYRFILD
jgi:hypothetical protein